MRARCLWRTGALVLILAGCTRGVEVLQDPPHAVAVTTSGAWASMIYLARTDSGVIAIDLGWTGAEAALQRGTRRLGATTADVRFAFVTHAHRDHIGGWRHLPRARFVLGRDEVPYFTGAAQYQGLVPAGAERMRETERPADSAVSVIPVAQDTAFTLGSDTLWAYPVPGHTAGSVASVFRGVLFGGDAVNYRPLVGFQGARPEMSDDPARSRASLAALWLRLVEGRVRSVCSAHAKCAEFDQDMRRDLLR
jgi:glyoxylase-like metal-dependent hydrolase (beta-lactamase superfamily II)